MFQLIKTEGPCENCRYITDDLLKISFILPVEGQLNNYSTYLCKKCILSILDEGIMPWGMSEDDIHNITENNDRVPEGLPYPGVVEPGSILDFLNNYGLNEPGDKTDESMTVSPPPSDKPIMEIEFTDEDIKKMLGVEDDDQDDDESDIVLDYERMALRNKYSFEHLDYMLNRLHPTPIEMYIYKIDDKATDFGFLLAYVMSTALFLIVYALVTTL